MVKILDLSEAQNHRCCYCGHHMIRHVHFDYFPTPPNAATKDHVKPRVYGGETTWENMVAACYQCNTLRGEVPAETFYTILQRIFRDEPELWESWHDLDRVSVYRVKLRCVRTEVTRLSGIGRRHIPVAWQHVDFVNRYRTRYPIAA